MRAGSGVNHAIIHASVCSQEGEGRPEKPILAGGGTLLIFSVAVARLTVMPVATRDMGPRSSAWGPASPLGAPFTDIGRQQGCPLISKDGLDLYFRAQVHPPNRTEKKGFRCITPCV